MDNLCRIPGCYNQAVPGSRICNRPHLDQFPPFKICARPHCGKICQNIILDYCSDRCYELALRLRSLPQLFCAFPDCYNVAYPGSPACCIPHRDWCQQHNIYWPVTRQPMCAVKDCNKIAYPNSPGCCIPHRDWCWKHKIYKPIG